MKSLAKIRKNRRDRKGKKQGLWENYTLDGDLMYKGSFKDDLKDGIWEHYDRDGKVISIKIYQNGVQI